MSVNKPFGGARKVRPAPHVTASVHEDGVVFLDTIGGRLFSANRLGAEVWRGIGRGLGVETIVTAIVDAYGIAYATARADSERFLAELARHGLVEESSTQ